MELQAAKSRAGQNMGNILTKATGRADPRQALNSAMVVSMDNLPPEVLTLILEKTEWSDLLECRKVSKRFKELADLVKLCLRSDPLTRPAGHVDCKGLHTL